MDMKYNNAPAYEQLHDVTGTQGNHIHLADDGVWYVGHELGISTGGLRNINSTNFPPKHGWEYWNGEEWISDQELSIKTVTDISILICPSVTITASGETENLWPQYLGQFKPTSQFSGGRPIFSNSSGNLLLVVPGTTAWAVQDNLALVYLHQDLLQT